MSALARPRLAAKARLKWDKLGSRYMILYPERGIVLNKSAASIVKMCDGARSIDGIIAELVSTSVEADPAQIRADVLSFLGELRKLGLLDESSNGAAR